MKHRLNSRCKGLLEATRRIPRSSTSHKAEQSPQSGTLLLSELKVEYLHRTVKDFLANERIWNQLLAVTDSFDPNFSLCRSFLLQIKTSHPETLTTESLWDMVTWCIEYSSRIAPETGIWQTRLLDELDRAAQQLTELTNPDDSTFTDAFAMCSNAFLSHWTSTRLTWIRNPTFLNIAA